ncbi:MAG: peptide deformylase [Brevinemataceae bacterium]
MAVRQIVSYGHPALRMPADPVEQIDSEILEIITDLKDTLKYAKGLGLAAPQIGISKQIFIADLSILAERKYLSCKVVFINPEIIYSSKNTASEQEGCLSFPEVHGNISRSVKIKMKGLIPSGTLRTIEASGLFARCLQHEYDHLHGKLFIDYFSTSDMEVNKRLINSILEQNKNSLPKILE